jgi:hypothetical protein
MSKSRNGYVLEMKRKAADRELAYGIALALLAVTLVGAANLLVANEAMAGELADQSSGVVAQAASAPAHELVSAPVDAKSEPLPSTAEKPRKATAEKPRKAERSVVAADIGLILGVGF